MKFLTKFFGAVFIIFATSGYGYVMSRDIRRHLAELKELKKIMFLLKGEISFGCTPIFQAAGNVAVRCDEKYREVLLFFAGYEDEIKNEGIGDIWKKSIDEKLTGSKLSKTEFERLRLLGDGMGLNDSSTQAGVIEAYLTELNQSIDELEKSMPIKLKLYRSLGLMSGVIISIVII